MSIYGGKVTSNPIERLHPVTYNTTLCISFPQNVRLGPYPCCEQATSDDAVKPVAFASPCFSRSDFSRLPQIGSLLELLNCRLQKSILNIFVYLFTLAKFCLQASWIQVFCTYFLVIIAVLNRFVYWWQKTVLIEESKRSCTKPIVRRKKSSKSKRFLDRNCEHNVLLLKFNRSLKPSGAKEQRKVSEVYKWFNMWMKNLAHVSLINYEPYDLK